MKMKNNKCNIFLFTIDDLRKDCLKIYNPQINVDTRNIELFAQDSTIFKNAFSVGSNTPNVLPSIFTGFKPIFFPKHRVPNYIKTIPEYLREKGYFTYGFNQGNAWCTKFFGFAKGFDSLKSYLDFTSMPDSRKLSKRAEKKMRNKFIDILKGMRQKCPKNPFLKILDISINALFFNLFDIKYTIHTEYNLQTKFITDAIRYVRNLDIRRSNFVWFHFMVNHWPWVPDLNTTNMNDVLKYNRKLLISRIVHTREREGRWNLYLDSIRTLDIYFGRIMEELKRINLYDQSMIVFTSDHGELFFEHNQISHPSKIFNELIEIPLIIKLPGNKRSLVENYFDNSQIFELIRNYIDHKSLKIDSYPNGIHLAMNYEFRDAFTEYSEEKKKKLQSFAIFSNELGIRLQDECLDVFEGSPIFTNKISLEKALMNNNLIEIFKEALCTLDEERAEIKRLSAGTREFI